MEGGNYISAQWDPLLGTSQPHLKQPAHKCFWVSLWTEEPPVLEPAPPALAVFLRGHHGYGQLEETRDSPLVLFVPKSERCLLQHVLQRFLFVGAGAFSC